MKENNKRVKNKHENDFETMRLKFIDWFIGPIRPKIKIRQKQISTSIKEKIQSAKRYLTR